METNILSYNAPSNTVILDMRHLPESKILKTLLEVTKATPCAVTAEESTEKEELSEDRKQRQKARDRQLKINQKRKYERDLIEQAKETKTT